MRQMRNATANKLTTADVTGSYEETKTVESKYKCGTIPTYNTVGFKEDYKLVIEFDKNGNQYLELYKKGELHFIKDEEIPLIKDALKTALDRIAANAEPIEEQPKLKNSVANSFKFVRVFRIEDRLVVAKSLREAIDTYCEYNACSDDEVHQVSEVTETDFDYALERAWP